MGAIQRRDGQSASSPQGTKSMTLVSMRDTFSRSVASRAEVRQGFAAPGNNRAGHAANTGYYPSRRRPGGHQDRPAAVTDIRGGDRPNRFAAHTPPRPPADPQGLAPAQEPAPR